MHAKAQVYPLSVETDSLGFFSGPYFDIGLKNCLSLAAEGLGLGVQKWGSPCPAVTV